MKFKTSLLLGLLAAALSGTTLAAVTAKFAVTLPEKSHQGQGVAKFVELVKAKSGGEIDIKPYYGGALGDDVKVTSALQGGTIEFTSPCRKPPRRPAWSNPTKSSISPSCSRTPRRQTRC